MQILLFRLGPESDWHPLTHLAQALASHTPTAIGIVTESADPVLPRGSIVLPGNSTARPVLQAAFGDATRSGQVGWLEKQ